jgi:MYXO-CTERM domain-containing protein
MPVASDNSSGGCNLGHAGSSEFGAAALALALIFATRRRNKAA